jgi:hypothetical protein
VRYMFLIYSRETDEPLSPDEFDRVVSAHRALMADAGRQGILLGVERLKPTSTATTLRVKDGVPITIDGPFAETKEQLAGYYILECKNLDEAIEWGKRIPTMCQGREGSIEIRPVDDLKPEPA